MTTPIQSGGIATLDCGSLLPSMFMWTAKPMRYRVGGGLAL